MIEHLNAGWKQVVGFLMIGSIAFLFSSFEGVGDSVRKGEQAFEQVGELRSRQDSLEASCTRQAQKNELFQQGVAMEVTNIKSSLNRMEQDQTDIKNYLLYGIKPKATKGDR